MHGTSPAVLHQLGYDIPFKSHHFQSKKGVQIRFLKDLDKMFSGFSRIQHQFKGEKKHQTSPLRSSRSKKNPWNSWMIPGFFDQISMVNTSRLGSCSNFFLNLTAWGDFANLRSSCPDGEDFFALEVGCFFSLRTGWV